MSDNLLAPIREIIHLCDVLLSEIDNSLNEKQCQWVESIRECASDRPGTDRVSAGLLNTFNRYIVQTQSKENIFSAKRELFFAVPTPITLIRVKAHMLMQSGEHQESIQQIQHCIDQIENELDRIRDETY